MPTLCGVGERGSPHDRADACGRTCLSPFRPARRNAGARWKQRQRAGQFQVSLHFFILLLLRVAKLLIILQFGKCFRNAMQPIKSDVYAPN